jgi:hypothetical protein
MSRAVFNRATHFSIVWGITLALLTLMEWRSLDRDPLGQKILTPFIEREVRVRVVDAAPAVAEQAGTLPPADEGPDGALQYEVELHFNGPLFLLVFFAPVLLFHGIGWLGSRAGRRGAGSG